MDTKSELNKLKIQVATLRTELQTERKLRAGRREFFREFVDDCNEEFLARYYSDEGHQDSQKGFG